MSKMLKKSWVFAVVLAGAAVAGAVPEDKTPREEAVEAYDSPTRGAIQVKGDTTDWFEVYRAGKAVAYPYPLLGKTVEVEAGEYEVQVNRTVRKVKVEAGKKVVLGTGT